MIESRYPNSVDLSASVILVDKFGTAFLVVATPSSFCRDWPQAQNENHSANILGHQDTPVKTEKNLTNVVSNLKRAGDERAIADSLETSKRQKIESMHAKDKDIVETAIFERKNQLEKSAEQRAEIVFKQWNKEKKTLEQAIDESFR